MNALYGYIPTYMLYIRRKHPGAKTYRVLHKILFSIHDHGLDRVNTDMEKLESLWSWLKNPYPKNKKKMPPSLTCLL
jgi:hypothetical protein